MLRNIIIHHLENEQTLVYRSTVARVLFINILQVAWQLDMRNAIDTPLDRAEINRLANEVRKAAGIPIPQ